MFTIYDESDLNLTGPATATAWKDRKIAVVIQSRSPTHDFRAWVKEKDGEPEKTGKNGKPEHWIYNHHVAHSRIVKAVEASLVTFTRDQALNWLASVCKDLSIAPSGLAQPREVLLNSRFAYDEYVNWATAAICDWRENIFYGPGKNTGGQIALDTPTGETNGAKQLERVEAAKKVLVKIFGEKLTVKGQVLGQTGEYWFNEATIAKYPELVRLMVEELRSKDEHSDEEEFEPMEDE